MTGVQRKASAVLEEYRWLRDWTGLSNREIASRLGYKDVDGLKKALRRAAGQEAPGPAAGPWREVTCPRCGATGWTRCTRAQHHTCGTRNWDPVG